MYGYFGKFLRVDLNTKKITEEKIEDEIFRTWVGGTGLGLKILYDEVPAGVGALDPENRIIFATGPLTGTAAPGSGTYSLVSKSPLTNCVASAQSNGFFGARLKKAGYDAIVIQGASDKPVYLWVNDGAAEIRDAEKLWGTTTFECEEKVKGDLNQKNASVACIGPAGENLMKGSCVMNDYGHIASSGGLGAVLGSKKLKAVAVIGTQKIPLADEQELRAAAKRLADINKDTLYGSIVNTAGTPGQFPMAGGMGIIPQKNATSNVYQQEVIENFGNIRSIVDGKRNSCWACPYNHSQIFTIKEGPYKGFVAEEPEYEDLAGFGINMGNNDVAAAIYLTHVNDGLGMDVKESAWLISFALECYENGIITTKDTDGLELKWGDVKAVETLLGKIARREGVLGNILAEGIKRASYMLGAPERAVYAKNAGIHVIDLRGLMGTLFDASVSETASAQGNVQAFGGDPEAGNLVKEVYIKGVEAPFVFEKFSKSNFINSLILCYFNVNITMAPILFEPHILDLLRAATGWKDYTLQESLTLSERIMNLARVFNIKHGLTPEDETPSPRMLAPPRDGPAQGVTMKQAYKGLLSAYYSFMGWDERTGKPLKSTLENLGLGYCYKDIYP
jgi:aldehyde:ferredoxin oxidoreductase